MEALAITEGLDHVCCRYRVRAFVPALERAGVSLRVEALRHDAAGRLAQLHRAGRYDVVLLQRKLLPGWQLDWLRARSRRLVFDFDDAVVYRDSYDPRGPHCPRRARRFARTVQAADVILAGNSFLAGLARDAGARETAVRVLPTCVDTNRLRPAPGTEARQELVLAWIGSSSTLKGLEQERELLTALGREVSEATLRLICDRFAVFDPLRVEAVPWSEAGEISALATADAGISLIPDDLWSRGKCGLKVLQYLACGLPVVANAVGVHPEMIRPEHNGFLPGSAAEWFAAVRTLRDDPHRAAEMGRAARRTAVERYSVEAWQAEFVRALAGTKRAAPLSPLGRTSTPAAIGRG